MADAETAMNEWILIIIYIVGVLQGAWLSWWFSRGRYLKYKKYKIKKCPVTFAEIINEDFEELL